MIINFYRKLFLVLERLYKINVSVFIISLFILFFLTNFTLNESNSNNNELELSTNIENPIKVLVFDFKDDPETLNSGHIFTSIFMDVLMELTEGRYIPIERNKINDISQKFDLEQADLVDEDNSKKIGRLAGADAVILGKVTLWKKGNFFTQAIVGYTARCISIETGKVLWYSSFSKAIWKNRLEQRKPELIAKDVAFIGLSSIKDRLMEAQEEILFAKNYETPSYIFEKESDVDKNIPVNTRQYPYRFALIVGNEDYSSYQPNLSSEINVDYARNDAFAFKEYSLKTLGIPERNITTITNATAAQIKQGIDRLSMLAKASEGDAELFIYYAGHGIADQVSKESYIVPVDVSGSNLDYAIKLQDIYVKLSQYECKRIIFFIDACFSGGARNKELLATRGVKIAPKKGIVKGNMLVFTSSNDNESSHSYHEKKHGLFTYFLLRSIKDSKGGITYFNLYEDVRKNVSLEAILNNNEAQSPSLIISPEILNKWKNWKINE